MVLAAGRYYIYIRHYCKGFYWVPSELSIFRLGLVSLGY